MAEVTDGESLLVAVLCVAGFMGELEACIEEQVRDGGFVGFGPVLDKEPDLGQAGEVEAHVMHICLTGAAVDGA